MNFAVVTPFSRFENKQVLIAHLKPMGVTWHPLLSLKDEPKFVWNEPWIKPYAYQTTHPTCPNYEKLNYFMANGIDNSTYYCFLNDDDHFEPTFFDKLRQANPKELVLVVSMLRGHNKITYPVFGKNHPTYTLPAAKQNMKECLVGVEQLIIKGALLRNLKFDLSNECADGKLANQLANSGIPIKYIIDCFVWFNYLEKGRYDINPNTKTQKRE